MVHEIILFIHDRACAADEQQRITVVQLPHLVWGQQLLATMSSDEFKKEKIGLGMAIVKGLIAV